jgi:hypothetical protein
MKDNKQLPQLIVVGLLVAVLAGYCIVKFTGTKHPPTPPPPTTQTAQAGGTDAQKTEPGPTEGADAVKTGTEPDPAASVMVAANGEPIVSSGARDPFEPTMATTIMPPTPMPPERVHQPRPRVDEGRVPFIPSFPKLPNGVPTNQTSQAQGTNSGNQSSNPTPTQQEEPFPQFVLTGVITGRTNVAIVRLNEGRYIVKPGQQINGTYQVVEVRQDGVLISHNGRTVLLKLGGEGNAK